VSFAGENGKANEGRKAEKRGNERRNSGKWTVSPIVALQVPDGCYARARAREPMNN